MKKIFTYILSFLIIFIFCISSLMAQEYEKSYENRDKAEKNISKFNNTYFDDKESKHVIIYFDIEDGKLILSSKQAKLVKGKMQYVSKTGGSFQIMTKGSDGKVLSKFYIQDPTKIQIIDEKESAMQPIKNAKDIQIVIPYDSHLQTLEFAVDKEKYEFDILEKIKNLQ